MRTLSADTSPAVESMQLAIMARLPAWRKVALIAGMNAMLSGLAIGGLRTGHPGIAGNALWYRLDEHRLGVEAARQLERAREAGRIIPEEAVYVAGNPLPTILAVIAALDSLGIPYLIGGSLASGIYGTYRATAGVDIVADLREEQVDDLVRLLAERFYADAGMMRDAIRHRSSFNLLDLQSGFKVDVFVPHMRAFERSRFARRMLVPLMESGRESAYVSSAEDTVLAKLEWYRIGGEVSERQWNDVLGILKVKAADVDQAYLRYWAAQLNLAELLERALRDAGLS